MRNRAKGTAAEREAALLWGAVGTVRGLEAGGDHLIVLPSGLTVAQEVKRCERLKIPEWQRQLYRDAPAGSLPVLTYRQNRGEWYSVLRTAELVALFGGAA